MPDMTPEEIRELREALAEFTPLGPIEHGPVGRLRHLLRDLVPSLLDAYEARGVEIERLKTALAASERARVEDAAEMIADAEHRRLLEDRARRERGTDA